MERGKRLGVFGLVVVGWIAAPALGCAPGTTQAARSHARPWRASLAILFDDQNDLCVPWAQSQEVWAVNERTLHERRVLRADIIAVGTVKDLITSDTPGARNQNVFHFRVKTLIRGTRPDLPGGSRDLRLAIAKDQEARITRGIVGRPAVLFLRWVPKGTPAFHWHMACATPGVTERTRFLNQAGRK